MTINCHSITKKRTKAGAPFIRFNVDIIIDDELAVWSRGWLMFEDGELRGPSVQYQPVLGVKSSWEDAIRSHMVGRQEVADFLQTSEIKLTHTVEVEVT